MAADDSGLLPGPHTGVVVLPKSVLTPPGRPAGMSDGSSPDVSPRSLATTPSPRPDTSKTRSASPRRGFNREALHADLRARVSALPPGSYEPRRDVSPRRAGGDRGSGASSAASLRAGASGPGSTAGDGADADPYSEEARRRRRHHGRKAARETMAALDRGRRSLSPEAHNSSGAVAAAMAIVSPVSAAAAGARAKRTVSAHRARSPRSGSAPPARPLTSPTSPTTETGASRFAALLEAHPEVSAALAPARHSALLNGQSPSRSTAATPLSPILAGAPTSDKERIADYDKLFHRYLHLERTLTKAARAEAKQRRRAENAEARRVEDRERLVTRMEAQAQAMRDVEARWKRHTQEYERLNASAGHALADVLAKAKRDAALQRARADAAEASLAKVTERVTRQADARVRDIRRRTGATLHAAMTAIRTLSAELPGARGASGVTGATAAGDASSGGDGAAARVEGDGAAGVDQGDYAAEERFTHTIQELNRVVLEACVLLRRYKRRETHGEMGSPTPKALSNGGASPK